MLFMHIEVVEIEREGYWRRISTYNRVLKSS